MEFGTRSLYPHPLAKRLKVSATLVRKNPQIASFIKSRLAYKFAVPEENAFLNGSGVNQPLGIFTASDHGIPKTYDVSTGNTNTAITADGLINCKYDMPKQYRRNCRWIFHRDAIKMIRKLKDGNGQYIWRQGLNDTGDTILELPFDESEYAPNTFTAGLHVGIIGDFSNYWIVDSLDMQIVVAKEIYIETNKYGYFGRAEVDGAPVLAPAFRRVTLSS